MYQKPINMSAFTEDNLRGLLIDVIAKNQRLNTKQLFDIYNCVAKEFSFQVPLTDPESASVEEALISRYDEVFNAICGIDISKSEMPKNGKEAYLKAIQQAGVTIETVNETIQDNLRGFVVYFLKTNIQHSTRPNSNINALKLVQGKFFFSMGQVNEAEPMLVDCYETLKSKLGPNNPLTMEAMDVLANLYISIIKYPQAEKVLKELLKAFQSKNPESNEMTDILHKLGTMQVNLKEYDRAEPYFNEIVKIFKKTSGKVGEMQYPVAVNGLATIYYTQGRLEDSIPMFTESLKFMRSSKDLGSNHPDTLDCINQLAHVYISLNQFTAAEPLLEEVFFGFKALYGGEDIKTLDAMHDMALNYKNLGDMENAEKLVSFCAAKRTSKLGLSHPDTLASVDLLCTAYEQLGERHKTGPLYLQLINARKETLGPTHVDTIKATNSYGMWLFKQEKYVKAEGFLLEVLNAKKATLGPG